MILIVRKATLKRVLIDFLNSGVYEPVKINIKNRFISP